MVNKILKVYLYRTDHCLFDFVQRSGHRQLTIGHFYPPGQLITNN